MGWFGLTHLKLHKLPDPEKKKEKKKGAICCLWNSQCSSCVENVSTEVFWVRFFCSVSLSFFFRSVHWFRSRMSWMGKKPRVLPNWCVTALPVCLRCPFCRREENSQAVCRLCKQEQAQNMETVTNEKVETLTPLRRPAQISHTHRRVGAARRGGAWCHRRHRRICRRASPQTHARPLACTRMPSILCQARWRGIRGQAVLAAPSVYACVCVCCCPDSVPPCVFTTRGKYWDFHFTSLQPFLSPRLQPPVSQLAPSCLCSGCHGQRQCGTGEELSAELTPWGTFRLFGVGRGREGSQRKESTPVFFAPVAPCDITNGCLPLCFGGGLCEIVEQAKCIKNGLLSFSLRASQNYIQCYWKQLSSCFHYTGFFILHVGVFNVTHQRNVNLHKCQKKKIVSLFFGGYFCDTRYNSFALVFQVHH